MIKCAICGKECKNYNSLAQHIKSHNITSKEYYDKFVCPGVVHTCKYCGKIIDRFVNINVGYAKTCGIECSRHNVFKHINIKKRNEKAAKTKLEKYGSATYNNSDKCRKTIEAFTEDQKLAIKEKRKLTCQKKYGVDAPMQSIEVKKHWEDNYFEKTGYRHPSENPEVIAKIKATNLQRYGVDNVRKCDLIKEKIKNTKLARYGNQNNIEKTRSTNLERYGVPCSWQNPDVRAKCFQRYLYEDMNFDSSLELAFYIYNQDSGKNIIRNPNIYFEFELDGKIHRCFPDFMIDDHLYEIKGDQFLDKESERWIDPFKTKRDDFYEAKHQCLLKNNVCVIYQKDMQSYIDYVNEKYGRDYLKQFRKMKSEDKENLNEFETIME